ncbi:TonB-dependent receptor [Puteibacter caeruleilacunae]|nr:TonB-dependent receptor [Puteibacter caeruleilacunae]
MKTLLTILIFIALPCLTIAQTTGSIRGTIKDKATGKPLPSVSIYIDKIDKGTTSDDDGHYHLSLPKGKYLVSFSFIGYETQKRNIEIGEKVKSLNINLIESYQNIKDITVTAKSEIRELREQAMPVSIISMKEIQGTVSDINDVLSKTAGVTMRKSGAEGSASRISVRGLEGKRIGFFIDGTPMNDNSDFIGINDIPVDMIDRIEVYKGIVPAKFGGSAIGGAVNIVLIEYPPRYMDFAYNVKSFNTHKVNAIFKRNTEEKGYEYGIGGWYTNAENNYKMELPLQPGHYITRDHDRFEKTTIGGGFTSKSWWFDEVVFEPAIIFTNKEIQGIEYNIQGAENNTEAYALNNHNEKTDFLFEGLDLEFTNSYGYSVFKFKDNDPYRYDWDGTRREALSELGGEIGTTPNNSQNKKHTFIQKTNLSYLLNQHHSFNFNSVYNYAKGIPQDVLKDQIRNYKTNFNSKMNSLVAGLSHEYHSLDEKFINVFSAKYYRYSMKTTLVDSNGSNTINKINMKKEDVGVSNAIRYRFTPTFLAKASLAYDVRLPAENELLGNGFIILPAGDLEPERNTSANVGVMYDATNNQGNRLQLELNAFYTYLENMIRYTGGPLNSVYVNFGKMRTLGIEGEFKWDATNFMYLYGNATYQDLRDARKYEPNSHVINPTKDDRMPNVPYFYFNSGFELHRENLFGGKGQNSRLYSDLSFIEEYFYDFEQSKYQERRIPRATTVNIGLEHSFNDGHIIFSISGYNVTDAKVISEFNRPMPGRNYSLKVRYIWK